MTGPLLNPTDFASFQAKDSTWFLNASGETIRDYCGWHVYPVVSVTGLSVKIGEHGVIMLPTLRLVSVESLSWTGVEMDVDSYEVHEEGWVQQIRPYFGTYGCMRNAYATVDFTHGYDELPAALAEVGYELAARTMEKPAGVVKHMTRGPTDLDFLEFGAVLSDDQKARLDPYALTRVR